MFLILNIYIYIFLFVTSSVFFTFPLHIILSLVTISNGYLWKVEQTITCHVYNLISLLCNLFSLFHTSNSFVYTLILYICTLIKWLQFYHTFIWIEITTSMGSNHYSHPNPHHNQNSIVPPFEKLCLQIHE